MKFSEVLKQASALLQDKGQVSYRMLRREFDLDDAALEDLKAELIEVDELAVDRDGKMLVWTGKDRPASSVQSPASKYQERQGETAKRGNGEKGEDTGHRLPPPSGGTPDTGRSTAERRQLTVLFCDLVGSTALSTQLDPEDLRSVVQQYQQTCAEVIQRHEGYIAQYLGDGLLVYFGYPVAHEDDAARAVRTGLGIISTMQEKVPSPFQGEGQGEGSAVAQSHSPHPSPLPKGARGLTVRIGIHSGLVVIGDIGASGRTEQLALGETPNIAARIQSVAEPNTVMISAVTQRLVEGQFESQPCGSHLLKGIDTPMAVYHVQSERQGTAPLAWRTTFTPLVGREEELALLQRRWEQVKDHEGQVALLSGEPGIGKSRLVRELRDRVERDDAVCIEFRCSPYHQNSALQPVIEHVQRLLHWQKEETSQSKLTTLQMTLARYRFPQADTFALFAALLSLPQPADGAPLNLSPQRQKQKTEEALIAWLIEAADSAPLYCVWEDVHWADPSTLELLGMLLDQTPTNRLLVLLTSRPEFTPPWGQHAHFSQLTLSRLGRRQVPQMITQATGGKTLPAEVLQQIVAKTDGVPLFVEELTKMVLESGLLTEAHDHYELTGPLPPLAIPSTLQDSLMARLDRLAAVRELAQLGATIGREFSYELLQAVSSLDNEFLQNGLQQLVATELVYQRGTPPHATYLFKHALIQDTAYQSLLKSRRQQLHQQIAQVLEEQFPDTKATQPELLAHHYTEANLIEQAIPYWQQAGQRAIERSANEEAVRHLTTGIELLRVLPLTPQQQQSELVLQTMLGVPLMATKGWAAPEVGRVFSRAHELSQQVEETPQLFPIMIGLTAFYTQHADYQTGQELLQRCLRIARRSQDSVLTLVTDYFASGLFAHQGNFTKSQEYYEHGLALYDITQHSSLGFRFGLDPGLGCRYYAIISSWFCGYPNQALKKAQEAWALAHNLPHPPSQAWTALLIPWIHLYRREAQAAQEWAETAIAFATEKEQIQPLAFATMFRGYALAEQGRREEGLSLLQKGLADWHATGAKVFDSLFLVWQAQVCRWLGRVEDELTILAEAHAFIEKTGERIGEAELYRLKGELTRQKGARDSGLGASSLSPQAPSLKPQDPQEVAQEAEGYFLKAIAIARLQQAKSWELRAAMSLARLWQQQGKSAKAHQMLLEIYHWFTEGFDTKDLQEAKALLIVLEERP